MNDYIKEFLVGLGFDVDEASLSKFNKAITNATVKVAALYATIKVAAAGIGYGISKISEGFENLGYEMRLIAPSINRVLALRREMLRAYSAAGVNLTRVIQNSVRLNFSLKKTEYAFEAIYKSVASRFFPLLTKQSDIFREKLYRNMPRIQAGLEHFVNFIFKAFEATVTLGTRAWSILNRIYDFFVMLDQATNGWSTKILAALAAWKLLNLGFLATPLGFLITGLVALLALWDDFKTFKEGGQSLIDWSSNTTKSLVAVAAAVAAVVTALYAARAAILVVNTAMTAFNFIASLNPFTLWIVAVTALVGLLTALDAKWSIFGGKLSGFFSGIGGRVLDFIGGTAGATNAVNNMQSNPIGGQVTNPVGSGAQNSQTNQHVQQQTNISVNGSADANATAKAVSSQQNRVNFDMTRNLRGATR